MNILITHIYNSPIFKRYQSLSNIIYKQNYLIPQKPDFPMILSPPSLKQLYIKAYPEKANAATLEQELNNINSNLLLAKLKERIKQERIEFASKVEKHHQKYICAIRLYQTNLLPHQLYFQQERETVIDALRKSEKKPDLNAVEDYFKKLSQDVQNKYTLRCQEIMEERVKNYGPVATRHRIPSLLNFSGKDVYNQMMERSKAETTKKDFEKLSEKERDRLNVLAKTKNEQSKKEIKSFFNRLKVSQKRYKQILQTCADFKKELRKIASEAKVDFNRIQKFEEDKNLWLQLFDHSLICYEKPEALKQFEAAKKKEHKSTKKQNKNHQENSHLKDRHLNYIDDAKQDSTNGNNKTNMQQTFEESEYLNYDYEQLRLLKEINKKLKKNNKNKDNDS